MKGFGSVARACRLMRKIFFLLLLTVATTARPADGDTLRIVGFTAYATPTWQISMNSTESKWLRQKQAFAFGGELHFSALPCDTRSCGL